MKNKAIIISLLLNTCIATNVYAQTIIDNTNYFYFGSKFNTLQPNHIHVSDIHNLRYLYNNYWSHSLYGFLIGYQSNSYFGLEISYNDPFMNIENPNDIIKKNKSDKINLDNYAESLEQKYAKINAEEEKKINQKNKQVSKTSYVNISNSSHSNNPLLSIDKKNHTSNNSSNINNVSNSSNIDHSISKNKSNTFNGNINNNSTTVRNNSSHQNKNDTESTSNTSIKKIKTQSAYVDSASTSQYFQTDYKKINKKNIYYPKKNLEITAKFSYPILSSIDIYSRLGCSINLNKHIFEMNNSHSNYSFKNNIFPLASIGIQYKVNKNLYSRIEFEKKITYYSDVTRKNNLNSINFNFIWNFKSIFSHYKYNNIPSSAMFANELYKI